jgi:hypothetical protein
MKTCLGCRRPMERRVSESAATFARRRFCSCVCANQSRNAAKRATHPRERTCRLCGERRPAEQFPAAPKASAVRRARHRRLRANGPWAAGSRL